MSKEPTVGVIEAFTTGESRETPGRPADAPNVSFDAEGNIVFSSPPTLTVEKLRLLYGSNAEIVYDHLRASDCLESIWKLQDHIKTLRGETEQ